MPGHEWQHIYIYVTNMQASVLYLPHVARWEAPVCGSTTYMVLDGCLKLAALYLCHQGVGLGNLLCTLSSCCSSCGSCSGPSTATCSNSCSCARLLVPITADATNGCCSTNLQCKQDDLQRDHHSNRASCAAGTPTALMIHLPFT
jgi:hypothetical protein